MKKGDFVLGILKERKTTYEFSNKKISDQDIMKILEAARFSPSHLNIQPWHFILIKNQKTIDKITRLSNYGHFHTNPPLMIAVVLNSENVDNSYQLGFKNNKIGYSESFFCIGMAALSITIEATALGISSSLLTPEKPDKVNEFLGLKKGDLAPIIVGLGYENPSSYKKPKERKELKSILSYETYWGKK